MLMNKCVFIYLLCLLAANNGSVLTINGEGYSLQQFYAYYPKKQWEIADSTKKVEIYTDFIKRKLCVLEAKRLGFEVDPSIAVKIRDNSQQILVNESYEHLVALPLIDSKIIDEARMFARKEIFARHILIGYSGSYLSQPPKRSLEDALLLAQNIRKNFYSGIDFSLLAEKYSDDPSVSQNAGDVGWVSWGATVQEFQSAAFGLESGLLSDPVLTPFGYHLILVTDSRPSDYQHMSNDEYESVIINLSKGSVRDRLRDAAMAYDSLQIIKHGVYFNNDVISNIVRTYKLKQKKSAIKNIGALSASDLLESIVDLHVVCVYDGLGLGYKWFANKIQRISTSRQPALSSNDAIVAFFKTIILQDIAINNGYLFNIDDSFSFIQRKEGVVSGLLYDAYLKYIVNNIETPSASDVRKYYNDNLVEKYTASGSVSVREIRVSSPVLADSLLGLLNNGEDFNFLVQNYSLINNNPPDEPLYKKNNPRLFDAASLLEPGNISPILSLYENYFSILILDKKNPGNPHPLESVYARIESALLKERQDKSKRGGVEGLFNKYNIERNIELLSL